MNPNGLTSAEWLVAVLAFFGALWLLIGACDWLADALHACAKWWREKEARRS